MSLKEDISEDFADIECELGNPVFTWKDQNYPFIPSSSTFANELDRGGYKVNKTLNITVRTNLFTGTLPTSQDPNLITYNGITYAIATVRPDPTGALLKIICVSDTRGS